MKCGLCGSGICADEKFKKLKDGSVNRHVYYGCTRAKDKNCKCGYINETELIKQLQRLVNKINLNEISIRQQVEVEVSRYKKFPRSLLEGFTAVKISDIDIRNYVKFILKDGNLKEKREIMSCFKSTIALKNKEVALAT